SDLERTHVDTTPRSAKRRSADPWIEYVTELRCFREFSASRFDRFRAWIALCPAHSPTPHIRLKNECPRPPGFFWKQSTWQVQGNGRTVCLSRTSMAFIRIKLIQISKFPRKGQYRRAI